MLIRRVIKTDHANKMAHKVKKTYGEKLLDPKWQQRRLEVFESDKWTCQFCGDKESTLHVHHFYYIKGGNPWDVDDTGLATVCENCHHLLHADIPDVLQDMMTAIQCSCDPNNKDLNYLRQWIVKIMVDHYPKPVYKNIKVG